MKNIFLFLLFIGVMSSCKKDCYYCQKHILPCYTCQKSTGDEQLCLTKYSTAFAAEIFINDCESSGGIIRIDNNAYYDTKEVCNDENQRNQLSQQDYSCVPKD